MKGERNDGGGVWNTCTAMMGGFPRPKKVEDDKGWTRCKRG